MRDACCFLDSPSLMGVLEHWEGSEIARLHLGDRGQLTVVSVTLLLRLLKSPGLVSGFFLFLLPHFSSFSSLLSISFLLPLSCLCVTHGNALTHLSTPLQTNHSVPLSLRCGSFPFSFALLVSLHMY